MEIDRLSSVLKVVLLFCPGINIGRQDGSVLFHILFYDFPEDDPQNRYILQNACWAGFSQVIKWK